MLNKGTIQISFLVIVKIITEIKLVCKENLTKKEWQSLSYLDLTLKQIDSLSHWTQKHAINSFIRSLKQYDDESLQCWTFHNSPELSRF